MPKPLDASPAQTKSIRRSATLPSKLRPKKQSSSDSLRASASENDLFFHPSAKIVHFSPRTLAPIPSSTTPTDFDYPVDTIETLPWRSAAERTVACAPLRLEKVHGLTVFLKCGSVVHAILKNSQCWCVDGESTFVLRIRPLTYYRIELPNKTEEDKELVTALKGALPTVLRYEVTPCPFKRGFTVEIPEEAKTPKRKRAWRPKGRRESAPPPPISIPETESVAEDLTHGIASARDDTDRNTTYGNSFTTIGHDVILETNTDEDKESSPIYAPGLPDPPISSLTETQHSFEALLARFEDTSELQVDPDTSLSSSVESFQSMEIPPSLHSGTNSPLTTASPASMACLDKFPDQRESLPADLILKLSNLPEAKASPDVDHSNGMTSSTGTLPRDIPSDQVSRAFLRFPSDAETDIARNLSDMSFEFRRRSKASREREIPALPPSSVLVSTSPPGKQDSTSIFQKTCTLVLVPPVQLFILLIHIAARIVLGPALNSAMGNFTRRLEYRTASSQEAVDDYDIPIAPDRRRETPESEVKKPDPWGLD